jgi:hypothetical protein
LHHQCELIADWIDDELTRTAIALLPDWVNWLAEVSSHGVPPVDHAVWVGIQGLAVKASRMASMGRRPWLRALTR